ncbi:MAG: IS4 family transposase [Desulfococcaceae bacterium]|jgi:hypothetical protein|nr:IS4 family transposase [Desulfococcaceae bacterium]
MRLPIQKKPATHNFFSAEGLTDEEIERIAFESGFCKRRSGKIKAPDFLIHFCLQSLKGTVSYNDIAAKIEAETDINASRQAYHQRMGEECLEFFERILSAVTASKYCHKNLDELKGLNTFFRILVQDSTVIRLPLRLFEIFSGVKNAHSAVCNARIQGVYDLLSEKFIDFSIDPYSRNDLSAAPDISVEPGDLLLRDRGYFLVQAVQKLKKDGADSISRYKHKTKIYDIENGEEINLLEYLRKNGSIDREVLAGQEKFKIRITARPVNEETANLRRMKARKESGSKKPSKELPALMSWTIFITTVETQDLTFDMILKLYGLRWRIENIFKTWKSHFSFDKIHNVSEKQLRVLLTARLIMIVFIYHRLFHPLSIKIKKISDKRLSLMKFTRYIRQNLNVIYKIIDIKNISEKTIETVIRFCTYDTRKRKNFETQLEQIILEIDELKTCQFIA